MKYVVLFPVCSLVFCLIFFFKILFHENFNIKTDWRYLVIELGCASVNIPLIIYWLTK